MTAGKGQDDPAFRDAVEGLLRGDFSRLAPLFEDDARSRQCRIVEWYKEAYFDEEEKARDEALACACFLGKTSVARFLLGQGVDPSAGAKTGLNAFHWAANRGQLATVRLLIGAGARLESSGFPTGREHVDEVLRRHGAKASA